MNPSHNIDDKHNLGAVGGGAAVAQSMCLGPAYCRTSRGQCCAVQVSDGFVTCPNSC